MSAPPIPGLMRHHRQKGSQVNHTAGSAPTPLLRTVLGALREVRRSSGGSGARSEGRGRAGLRMAGLLALTVAALLALSVGSASALTTRQLTTVITQANGQTFTEAGHLLGGVATDSSGRLWVTDYAHHAVDRFSAAGAYEAQNLGTGSWEGSTEVRSLAYSASVDEVFAADSENEGHLFGLEPAAAGFSGKNLPLGLGGAINIAADNSAGATGGDLYIANGSKIVRIKASNGAADDFSEGPGAGTNELSAPFTSAGALAVAPDGDFYVGGGGTVYQFEPSGKPTGVEVTEAAGTPLNGIQGLAVDPGSGNLLLIELDHVFEFSSAGTYLREIGKPAGGGFSGLSGVAVGPSGDLYVSESGGVEQVDVFGPVVTVPDVTTGAAQVLSTTSATVEGEVNPAGIPLASCLFEYGTTTAYGQSAPCESPDAAEVGAGTSPVAVHADLAGLTPGSVYHYRLVASNAQGTNHESGDRELFTGATVDATSVSAVTATTARLETEINPHGTATSYYFQYGTTTAYGSETPMPPAPLGAGEADVFREAQIAGLQPSTTYHFRVVAVNALGTILGPDRTFATQGPASALLPDGRAWELVSPPDKHGVPLESLSQQGGMIQAAADGDGLAYIALGPLEEAPQGNRSGWYSQYLAHREGPGDWSTADITPPNQHPVQALADHRGEYFLFSSDLTRALFRPAGGTPLSPLATEPTPYLRQSDSSFLPLIYPGNVPPGTRFVGKEEASEFFRGVAEPVTATPDLSQIIFTSTFLLTEEFAPPFDNTLKYTNLYEWGAGALTLASQIPTGAATVCGGTAGAACEPAAESGKSSEVGFEGLSVRNALSADGTRLVFSVEAERLYLRDLARDETVQLDAPQGGTGSAGHGEFQIASADGSRVFFTDEQKLTEDSTAAFGKPDLYECRIPLGGSGQLACDLTDLTANAPQPSEPADVQGRVLAASEDGSSTYVVANGVLASNVVENGAGPETARPGDCEGANATSAQTCNLYLSHDGTLRFIAALSGADKPVWNDGGGFDSKEVFSRASDDGRWLTFMSGRPLTGYDNRDAVTGERDEEVFLYDATADGGAGKLVCASCDPSGARPHGVFDSGNGLAPGLLTDRTLAWGGHQLAASIPGFSRSTLLLAIYQSRYLSNSGRLFFNAADTLVPGDTNGLMDVYEYEPPGVGSCTASSPSYSPDSAGCVSLISSGSSNEESAFLDASETGDDVFFLTAGRLTAKDTDSALDIYDARVGGGEPEVARPVECVGDACQQPAVPPNDATPASLTFNGAGNQIQCPKGKKLQKGKCVKKQQKKAKKKHKKHHKKKGQNKQGGGKKQKRDVSRKGGGHK
jgi:hypothetical protein